MSQLIPTDFANIVHLIASAKQRAVAAVNTTLIDLYWQVGQIISQKISSAEWGDGVVNQLAEHLAQTQPGLRGFTRANLFRMRQFYETYEGDVKVAPLVRLLPWSHHMIILGQAKRPEEREFYLRIAAQEKWGKRELDRQFKSALFERMVLNPVKVSPAARLLHPDVLSEFKDAYMLEFLGLPEAHSESDLHKSLLAKLKVFLSELGRDFCFIGSEFPVQVGARDFALDLLFFHRGLNCLVAIELKVGRFEPEYLGKLSFYLEARPDVSSWRRCSRPAAGWLGARKAASGAARPCKAGRAARRTLLGCGQCRVFLLGRHWVAIRRELQRAKTQQKHGHNETSGPDRDIRKPHENPAIGVLLCASKDDEVVEYALSRTASPALIAQYETQLPDKALLQSKLHEFYLQHENI